MRTFIRECRQALDVLFELKKQSFSSTRPWKNLLLATRPHTAFFAFVATVTGFKLVGHLSWQAFAIGIVFGLATASIMLFNDLCDRERDVLKGKTLVRDFPAEIFDLWRFLSQLGLRALLAVFLLISMEAAALIAVVWSVGLFYSVNRRLSYPWNNLLVARCSIAPFFAGAAYTGSVTTGAVLVGWIVIWMIFSNEMIKDARDVEVDVGRKKTLATRNGSYFALIVAHTAQYPVALAVALAFSGIPLLILALCLGLEAYYIATGAARALSGRPVPVTTEVSTAVFLAALLTILLI